MTWNRRELLSSLGVAGAASLLWACSSTSRIRTGIAAEQSGEVRNWLHDAVTRLAPSYPFVHALATSRRRTTAAVDVLGAGVSRARSDGAVLVVRDREGRWHEEVTSELSGDGVAGAVRALIGKQTVKPKPIDFGRKPTHAKGPGLDPRHLDDRSLRTRAEAMVSGERSSRIVYAAGLIEIDDASVWSVAPGRDLEQRLVRVRRTATRVAWNGTRPVVSEASVAWTGGIDDQLLSPEQLAAAARGALELMTPTRFADGEYAVLLHPSVAASAVDAITRTLLTATAMRRPEVAARLAIGSTATADTITLVDDPTAEGAYGGFRFDDEGEPAAPITLLDRGRVAGRLGDRASSLAAKPIAGGRGRRPGHLGLVEVAPSHLRLAPGTAASTTLLGDGVVLEGARGAIIDPSSGRIVVAAARAREVRGGQPTGRVFADVELIGDLGVLASVTAMSSDVETITYRDDHDGLPRWRSIETPWILARGTVRARRNPERRT